MSKGSPRDLPKGITPKMRSGGGKLVPATSEDGTPLYRVRVWDPVLKKQIERVTEGLDVIDKIAKVKTGRRKGYQDAPMEDVIINSARRVDAK